MAFLANSGAAPSYLAIMRLASPKEPQIAAGSAAPAGPGCHHPACAEAGLYRAPKARDRLNEYYWFCLEHVRAYNKAWDYCAGMSEAELEARIRAATCWERPTWRLGDWHTTSRVRPDAAGFADPFGLFGEDAGQAEARPRQERPATPEARALALLELKPPVSWADIRARYKRLVKRFHPDANGGDKTAEERLKLINQAYTTLKNCGLF
jgi:DnaJ domain